MFAIRLSAVTSPLIDAAAGDHVDFLVIGGERDAVWNRAERVLCRGELDTAVAIDAVHVCRQFTLHLP